MEELIEGKDYYFKEIESFDHDSKSILLVINDGVKVIPKIAFETKKINFIKFPDSLTRIEAGAFQNCKHLLSVTIPDSVTFIGELAFYNCSSLRCVHLPKHLKQIYTATFSKSIISTLELPEELEVIFPYAFSSTDVSELNLPKNLKIIGTGAFFDTNIRKINYNDYLRIVATERLDKSFSCKASNSVSLLFNPNDTVDGLVDGNSKYSYTVNGDVLTFKDGVKGIGFFSLPSNNNDQIHTIVFPNSLEYIASRAFEKFNSINKVVMSNNIKFIGFEAMRINAEDDMEIPNSLLMFERDAIYSNKKIYLPENCYCEEINSGLIIKYKKGSFSSILAEEKNRLLLLGYDDSNVKNQKNISSESDSLSNKLLSQVKFILENQSKASNDNIEALITDNMNKGMDINSEEFYKVIELLSIFGKNSIILNLVKYGLDLLKYITPDRFHLLIHYSNNLLLEIIILLGFDINQKFPNGYTYLNDAAAHAALDIVRILIKHGANINATDNNGLKAIDYVTADSYSGEAIKKLLNSSLEEKEEKSSPTDDLLKLSKLLQ